MNIPRISLVVISDGRDELLTQTLASFREHARDYELMHTHAVDDREHALGFCGALSAGMKSASADPDAHFIFHLEEDWRFLRPFSVAAMAAILRADRECFQVSLLRGPHGDEGPAGPLGWPEVEPMSLTAEGQPIIDYLQHALYYTTNPNLIRITDAASIAKVTPPNCEGNLGSWLIDQGWHFAALGEGEPWIEHTGVQRTGVGY